MKHACVCVQSAMSLSWVWEQICVFFIRTAYFWLGLCRTSFYSERNLEVCERRLFLLALRWFFCRLFLQFKSIQNEEFHPPSVPADYHDYRYQTKQNPRYLYNPNKLKIFLMLFVWTYRFMWKCFKPLTQHHENLWFLMEVFVFILH